jgi:hypothetical protein
LALEEERLRLERAEEKNSKTVAKFNNTSSHEDSEIKVNNH